MNKYILLAFCLTLLACKNEQEASNSPTVEIPVKEPIIIPMMRSDSLLNFVQKQVDFGPRVPNSKGHQACAKWLETTLKKFGAEVQVQKFTAKAYTGKTLNGNNIIASYNPEHKRRVLLCAHWDTRHIAERAKSRKNEPILGADDAGSGVAVLLELARTLQKNPIDLGVDIVLFDLEDYGDNNGETESWCLGSQHWSKNPHKPNYKADFGILLDMVGAKNPRFTKEATSMRYAPKIMDKVWALAKDKGYGGYFDDTKTDGVVDDHYFVNTLRGIPTIDIINKDLSTEHNFGTHWHTHKDNMDIISKSSLKATGQVVLSVLYLHAAEEF